VIPAGVAAGAGSVFALRRRARLLGATVFGSISALLLVTGWLLADSGVTRVDAIKTGGLAGGAADRERQVRLTNG